MHPTSVTNAVDRLEDAGLVARSTHPDDRRAYLVALTPSGRELVERSFDGHDASINVIRRILQRHGPR